MPTYHVDFDAKAVKDMAALTAKHFPNNGNGLTQAVAIVLRALSKDPDTKGWPCPGKKRRTPPIYIIDVNSFYFVYQVDVKLDRVLILRVFDYPPIGTPGKPSLPTP
jgi:hypothetical protein